MICILTFDCALFLPGNLIGKHQVPHLLITNFLIVLLFLFPALNLCIEFF